MERDVNFSKWISVHVIVISLIVVSYIRKQSYPTKNSLLTTEYIIKNSVYSQINNLPNHLISNFQLVLIETLIFYLNHVDPTSHPDLLGF